MSEALPPLPADYELWSAERKQQFLWNERVIPTRYKELPPLERINVAGLFLTPLRVKMDRQADQIPRRWKKAIHAHGSVAKVSFRAVDATPWSGVFQGAQHGLLRLSLTGAPEARSYAPGMALKLLRDRICSANLSALVSLTGQGGNYNFFANELSNIVPVVREFGPKAINLIFRRVTRYPTRLYLQNFADADEQGQHVAQPRFPAQVFFRPAAGLGFPSTSGHDFRRDLESLNPGSLLYEVLAPPPDISEDSDQRAAAVPIGSLWLESGFVASQYGDSQLFFRHQRFRNR
jgi:hypothetical protein